MSNGTYDLSGSCTRPGAADSGAKNPPPGSANTCCQSVRGPSTSTCWPDDAASAEAEAASGAVSGPADAGADTEALPTEAAEACRAPQIGAASAKLATTTSTRRNPQQRSMTGFVYSFQRDCVRTA